MPGEDLLSALATDGRTWEGMSRAELLSNASLLLIAGHETTVNLITNGMLTLLRHPDLFERIRTVPGFAIRTVEELLRYEPPVHILVRQALDDIDVAGTSIPVGARISLVLAAGSRDPDHVHDPDRFDPDRHDLQRVDFSPGESQHLGFGGGVHFCFGAPLARLETQIALTELARRLENPRLLADPPPYRPNAVLRGPRHLPVGFDRIRPAERPDRGVPVHSWTEE
jgi:cytochrome P450